MPNTVAESAVRAFVREIHHEDNAAAVLAIIAEHHDCGASTRDVYQLARRCGSSFAGLMSAADELGLECRAIAADAPSLADQPLPAIAHLNLEDGGDAYVVLWSVDGDSVLVADPRTGIHELTIDAFEEVWDGSLMLLTPRADERLIAMRSPAPDERAKPRTRDGGLGHLSLVGTVIVVGASCTLALAGWLPAYASLPASHLVVLIAIACAAVGAALSYAAARSCASCSEVGKLVGGVPVGPAGHAFYSLLFVFVGLFAALGVHASLLALLLRKRLACVPCLVTALAAVVGGVASTLSGSPLQLALSSVAFVGGALGSRYALGVLAPIVAERGFVSTYLAIEEIAAQPRFVRRGHCHLIMLSREGCTLCDEYTKRILPHLRAKFGDALTIEKQRAAPGTYAPAAIVLGGHPVGMVGIPHLREIERAVDEARRGVRQPLRFTAGVRYIDL